MKSHLIIFILFYTLASSVYPNNEIERNINRGLQHSYHFRWDKAQEVFKDLIEKYPDRPEGYHFLSGVYVWYYLSSKDKNDLKEFTAYSDTAIDKSLEILSKNPDDDEMLYITGTNYSYRAIAFGTAENYLDAAWASKRSESFLSKALEKNPERYDAYLGLGLYNYAVGHIPAAFRWALKLAGISGDRDLGIYYIKIAADKGDYCNVEAKYYYSQIIAEVYNDLTTASAYLSGLVKNYPENILFNYSLASVKIKERELDEAERILRKILKKDDDKFIRLISFSNFLLGDVYFKKNEFDSAAVYYRNFLTYAPDKDYTGIASYRLGLCYEFSGDRETSQYFFENSKSGNMDIDDDIFAKRKGNLFAKRPLTENEIDLIKSANLIDSGNYTAAYDSLVELLDRITDDKLKAETYLYLSEAAFYLGNYQESLSLASAALKNNVSEEKWILPFANYYAARANRELGDEVAVDYFIKQAEDYKDYDYQNKMKNLLNSLRQVKQF
jgi:predicted negative regulator of RcsB-dependent stress response